MYLWDMAKVEYDRNLGDYRVFFYSESEMFNFQNSYGMFLTDLQEVIDDVLRDGIEYHLECDICKDLYWSKHPWGKYCPKCVESKEI